MKRRVTKSRLSAIVAEAAREVAAVKLASFEGASPTEFAASRKPPASSGKKAKVPKDRIVRLRKETAELLASGDWATANSGHLVALYASAHESVYGVEAEEVLDPKAWALATIKASRLTNQYFNGQTPDVVEFVRWTWAREKKRSMKAGDDARRIGWALQFSPTLVTDFRRWTLHGAKVQG